MAILGKFPLRLQLFIAPPSPIPFYFLSCLSLPLPQTCFSQPPHLRSAMLSLQQPWETGQETHRLPGTLVLWPLETSLPSFFVSLQSSPEGHGDKECVWCSGDASLTLCSRPLILLLQQKFIRASAPILRLQRARVSQAN